jgi:oligoendopeptidase F
MGYENDPATVENLVATVTKAFKISHRFYKLKAKMLKLKTLEYADRAAPVGRTKKRFTFPEAVQIVERAFRQFDPFYADTLQSFLQKGQIDAFPKVGKTSGAYCSHYGTLPVFVLLNHLPDFRHVTTLAHEMGHAFHSTLSTLHQPPTYRDYTIATAEVASTFFENLVFDELLPTLSPAEQMVALHDDINDSVSTIFRQIACYNFELALHTQIRKQGSLSQQEIAKLMNTHMAAYLGPAFQLREDDGYFFVTWSHLRNFFYVYTYAFGEIISSALYAKYKQDASFKDKIKHFLSQGGSASPEDIFAQIGADVRDPAFFQEGLKKIEQDIVKLEKLVAGKSKKN